MNPKDMLKILNKQWCNTDDIRKLGNLSLKKAQYVKRDIKNKLKSKGYSVPSYFVPTSDVVEYLKIDIAYLESRLLSEERLKVKFK